MAGKASGRRRQALESRYTLRGVRRALKPRTGKSKDAAVSWGIIGTELSARALGEVRWER